MIELYVFYEMHDAAGGARSITVVDFEGVEPYTSDVPAASASAAALSRAAAPEHHRDRRLSLTRREPARVHPEPASTLDDGRAQPPPPPPIAGSVRRRFDVLDATCTVADDKHDLLAVIESAGAGVGAFNEWMHALLVGLSGADRSFKAAPSSTRGRSARHRASGSTPTR